MSTIGVPADEPPQQDLQDLGLGTRLAETSRARFLNRDGTFNVERHGLPLLRTLNPFHALVTMTWPRFYALVVAAYLATHVVFAGAYLLCGEGALEGGSATTLAERALQAFFFSVQTLATIGYGRISPVGVAANVLVAVEALFGLMGFALATGLAFARFSRPQARILFSHNAVVAPYRGITGFMFRIVNEQTNQLLQVEATLVLGLMEEEEDGRRARRFYMLPLERHKVVFFPLHWVIVHPIDSKSPLEGVSADELKRCDAEFLVLLTAVDETFEQTVHARCSYKPHEVVFGARLADMFEPANGERVAVDLRRFHDVERIAS